MKPNKVDLKVNKEEHNINMEIDSNILLTDILESSSSVSIISTDLHQNILYWNTGAENIFGYKASEVIGKLKIHIIYDGAESKRAALKAKKLIISSKKGICSTCFLRSPSIFCGFPLKSAMINVISASAQS